MSKSPYRQYQFYGSVTVSERGQIVIPADARRDFEIRTGEKLLVLGDLKEGLALLKVTGLLKGHPKMLEMLNSTPS
jgi:AbrB family looped-hinge helix DNA binding protein